MPLFAKKWCEVASGGVIFGSRIILEILSMVFVPRPCEVIALKMVNSNAAARCD